ncbi:MAG: hypothetical protein AAF657_17860, partial [Acidobacteriota bacterium]
MALSQPVLERRGRPSTSAPAAGALPETLTLALTRHFLAEPQTSQAEQADQGLETRAAVAATWTARQQIESFGIRELYEAGFHDALQAALEDPGIGDWDYQAGIRSGQVDLRATEIGTQLGLSRAKQATQAVALASEVTKPSPEVRQPRLLDVFDAHAPMSTLKMSAEDAAVLGQPDPWLLYR